MRLRCPHCHNPIEVVDDETFDEVSCPSCGSKVHRTGDETISYAPSEGMKLGHFVLFERIGRGGMGIVWKAQDTTLHRIVAVKIPRRERIGGAEAELFVREARTAAQLKHPHIVPIHAIGEQDGIPYIVSDFIEGVTLSEWIEVHGLTVREAAELSAVIADAVHYAHESGVIHRDLKPSNILLDKDVQPHVTDFGLAKTNATEITVTVQGRVLGTLAYMSPEQARGDSHLADRRSDVFSMGVILFRLLTSTLPFRGSSRMIVTQIIQDDPPSPRKLNATIPRDLETICLKCLDKNPDRRYQSAAEFAEDLRRFLTGRPVQAHRIGPLGKIWRWSRREPLVASLAATVAIVTIVGLAIATSQWIRLKQAQTAQLKLQVETLLSANAPAVPVLIENLTPLRELVKVQLREAVDRPGAANFRGRLHAAMALTAFGEPQEEFLLSNIAQVPTDESSNLVAAMRRLPNPIATRIADASVHAAPDDRVRYILLIAALDKGDAVAPFVSNAESRAALIHGFENWPGDVSGWAAVLQQTKSVPLRASLCCALGLNAKLVNGGPDRDTILKTLASLYVNAVDTDTHSAAEYAIRRLGGTLPSVERTPGPVEGRHWFVSPLGLTMLEIRPGTFRMGDENSGSYDAQPPHDVTLNEPFHISATEVPAALYRQFLDDPNWPMSEKPQDIAHLRDALRDFPAQAPAQRINWFDAVMLCNWLSHQEGRPACYKRSGEKQSVMGDSEQHDVWSWDRAAAGFRLPVEAEWELSARAGAQSAYAFGNDARLLQHYDVFGTVSPAECGRHLPNSWGLFNVHGNLAEWCFDSYNHYAGEKQQDPVSDQPGMPRIIRGACHIDMFPDTFRVPRRISLPATAFSSSGTLGLRVVLGRFHAPQIE